MAHAGHEQMIPLNNATGKLQSHLVNSRSSGQEVLVRIISGSNCRKVDI